MNQSLSRKYANILATDLDGTLVGDDFACDNLLSWMRSELRDFGLVYITGRHLDSVRDLINERSLPWPDLLVSDVGAQIYVGAALQIDMTWQQMMTVDWQPERIRQIAANINGLKQQSLPNDSRVSFYSDGSVPAEQLRNRLLAEGLSFNYIFSSDRDLDILPAGGGKGEVLKYIVANYAAEGANILAAGDSGNDSSMLTAGYPGVIVANAKPELQQLEESSILYRAEHSYAAGILEGWQHFYGQRKQ